MQPESHPQESADQAPPTNQEQPQQPQAPAGPASAPDQPADHLPPEVAAGHPDQAKPSVSKASTGDHRVTMAIVATVIIVIVLAILAVYAYHKK